MTAQTLTHIWHQLQKLFKQAIIIGLSYSILFNISVILYCYSHLQFTSASSVSTVLELFRIFLFNSLVSILLIFGLSCSTVLLRTGSYALFLTSAICSYYLYLYKIVPSEDIVKIALEPTPQAAIELTSYPIFLWSAICLFICWALLRRTCTPLQLHFATRLITFLALLASFNNIHYPWAKETAIGFPTQYLRSAYEYVKIHIIYDKFERIDIAAGHQIESHADNDIIGILVIGESARSDHFGIGGYERDTTPLLKNIANLHFLHATSCATNTFRAVSCMMSGTNIIDAGDAMLYTSFLKILSAKGFDTTWLGTQSMFLSFKKILSTSVYDDVEQVITPTNYSSYPMYAHDQVMLPYLDHFLAKSGPKFIVLHTTGSHWHYDQRYTPEFKKFTPTCIENAYFKSDPWSCPTKKLINSYDNSILYTDHFLASVIAKIQSKNSFMLYMSDHGEGLGENGYYFHGGNVADSPEQYQVPLIFWASDIFLQKNQRAASALAKLDTDKTITQEYVMHTILDCLKIESDLIKQNFSLCYP